MWISKSGTEDARYVVRARGTRDSKTYEDCCGRRTYLLCSLMSELSLPSNAFASILISGNNVSVHYVSNNIL